MIITGVPDLFDIQNFSLFVFFFLTISTLLSFNCYNFKYLFVLFLEFKIFNFT